MLAGKLPPSTTSTSLRRGLHSAAWMRSKLTGAFPGMLDSMNMVVTPK
jgi:hypothetical protein